MDAQIKHNIAAVTLQSAKIMLGSSIAIFIAMSLELQYATSAGIITLLTLVTTKLETLKLSIYRLITYLATVLVALLVFSQIDNAWVSYGVFIFIIVFASEYVGWKATISVNAVIGTHFMTERDFSYGFIANELMLVVIGISLAMVLNAVHRNDSNEKRLLHNINFTERKLQEVLERMALYLTCEKTTHNVWLEITSLEKNIEHFIELAVEYNNNVFDNEGNYYEQYFEMRMKQCGILHNLHFEMRKMRDMPEEAAIVAEFVRDMKQYVVQYQDCREHLRKMTDKFEDVVMYDVPNTREIFESRAKLYHILMDLEDFVVYKKRFMLAVKDTKRYQRDYDYRIKKLAELSGENTSDKKKKVKKDKQEI